MFFSQFIRSNLLLRGVFLFFMRGGLPGCGARRFSKTSPPKEKMRWKIC